MLELCKNDADLLSRSCFATSLYKNKECWRKNMKLKRLVALFAFVTLGTIAAGCGNKKAEVKTITVGTGTNYRPFVYQTKSGKDTGYEIAVLKAIDKKLPQYKFKVSHYDFTNLFPALKNKRIDILANQIESNSERRKLYQFSKEGYTNYDLHIVSLYGKYHALKDLKGKKVYAIPGGNAPLILENYIKAHPENKFKIVYGNWSDQLLYKSFKNKTVDATLGTKFSADFTNKQLGSHYVYSDKPVNTSSTYYLFRKKDPDSTKLNSQVSKALKQLKDDGTLKKLSVKYLGGDYTN